MIVVTISRRRALTKAALLLALFGLLAASYLRAIPPRLASTAGGLEKPIQRAGGATDRVALTFDLTWGQRELAAIAAALEREQARATFFVSAAWLQMYPELAKSLIQHGHELGTVGQPIQDLTRLPAGEVSAGLRYSQALMERTLGRPARFFRPPGGHANDEVVDVAGAVGLVTVTWSLDGRDAVAKGPDEVVRRVVRRAAPGDIILLHASDYARYTAAALPEIVQGLRERGLNPVPLSRLLEPDPAAAPPRPQWSSP